MLSTVAEERLIVVENSWENIGNPVDLRCPPQGKELEVKYQNGDYLYLRFIELESPEETCKRYKTEMFNKRGSVKFPITVVEVNMAIGSTSIELSPESTTFGGSEMKGNFMSNCGAGISLDGTGINWAQSPVWNLAQKIECIEGTNVVKVNFGK